MFRNGLSPRAHLGKTPSPPLEVKGKVFAMRRMVVLSLCMFAVVATPSTSHAASLFGETQVNSLLPSAPGVEENTDFQIVPEEETKITQTQGLFRPAAKSDFSLRGGDSIFGGSLERDLKMVKR